MSILDLVFPKRCVGCGRQGAYFCTRCAKGAKLHFPQVCPVCERASVDGITHLRCRNEVAPDGLVALWRHEGAPRKIIHKLKYKFVADLACELASAAQVILQETMLAKRGFVLVPIPLWWQRENWRGFNHTLEVGKRIAAHNGWKTVPLLVRSRPTKPQVGLREKERKENVQGAFSLQKNYSLVPNNYCLLLFDDVWTTGSTIKEAVKTLKKAGFGEVWCLTLAR